MVAPYELMNLKRTSTYGPSITKKPEQSVGHEAADRAALKWKLYLPRLGQRGRYTTKPLPMTLMIDSLWLRVHGVWRRSEIAIRPGVSSIDVTAFETRYGVVLPTDVRDYFRAADGTGDHMDDGLYRFWPLAEVQPVHDVLVSDRFEYSDRYSYPDCFVFGDHCINCWDYAVRLTNDPMQPAPVFRVTGGEPPGEQMAASFREFMSRYAQNPDDIM